MKIIGVSRVYNTCIYAWKYTIHNSRLIAASYLGNKYSIIWICADKRHDVKLLTALPEGKIFSVYNSFFPSDTSTTNIRTRSY